MKQLVLFRVGNGSKINCPNTFEKQLASQPFQSFKSSLFFKSDNLFFHRFLTKLLFNIKTFYV